MKRLVACVGIGAGIMVAVSIAWTAGGVLAAPAPALSIAGHESPFACDAWALDAKARKQHFDEYGPKLRTQLKGARELSNGYEFTFASSDANYRILSTWMYQERLCCPFFDLDLSIDREGGPLRLTLSGREGVKEFIRSEFEPWFLALKKQG
jgi:hypothetical protein